MSEKYKNTYRCYLIDHHSPPSPVVQLDQLDPDAYEEFFQTAHIDSLMLYCKDHWGASYYDTKTAGAFRHDGLNIDLIRTLRPILEQNKIEFVAYYCIEYDAGAANRFPQWRVVDPAASR